LKTEHESMIRKHMKNVACIS